MQFKAYQSYKASGVEWLGDVPSHWSIRKLKDVGKLYGGSAFPQEYQHVKNEEIYFYKVRDLGLSEDGINLSIPEHTISRETAKHLKANIFPKNTIMYAKIGAALLLNRRRLAISDCCIDNNMTAYVVNENIVFHKYALFWLSTIDFGGFVNAGAVPSLSEGYQAQLPIFVPPLPEQIQITEFLEKQTARIDNLIAKQTALIALLEQQRQSLLAHFVTKGLNPQAPMKPSGVAWLGDVPEHWGVVPMWSIFERVKRTNHPNEMLLSVYRDHGVVPKDSRDDNHNVASEDLSGYQLLLPNELVINKMKAWQGSIAISNYKGIVSPAYFVYQPKTELCPEYMHHLLRSAYYIQSYKNASKGIRVGQWDLDPYGFAHIQVLLPPLEEQRQIAEKIQAEHARIDALICKQQALIAQLKTYRTSLISYAVTGKIDVREQA